MNWLIIFDLNSADDTELPDFTRQFIRAAKLGDLDALCELGMYNWSTAGQEAEV